MKLLLDYKTTRNFTILIKYIPDTVKEISASIAFTQDDTLMKIAVNVIVIIANYIFSKILHRLY